MLRRKRETINTSVYLFKDQVKRLKRLADAEGYASSVLIRAAIDKYLDECGLPIKVITPSEEDYNKATCTLPVKYNKDRAEALAKKALEALKEFGMNDIDLDTLVNGITEWQEV